MHIGHAFRYDVGEISTGRLVLMINFNLWNFLCCVRVFVYRKEGDHEFMNIVSNEIGDEVLIHFTEKRENVYNICTC